MCGLAAGALAASWAVAAVQAALRTVSTEPAAEVVAMAGRPNASALSSPA